MRSYCFGQLSYIWHLHEHHELVAVESFLMFDWTARNNSLNLEANHSAKKIESRCSHLAPYGYPIRAQNGHRRLKCCDRVRCVSARIRTNWIPFYASFRQTQFRGSRVEQFVGWISLVWTWSKQWIMQPSLPTAQGTMTRQHVDVRPLSGRSTLTYRPLRSSTCCAH